MTEPSPLLDPNVGVLLFLLVFYAFLKALTLYDRVVATTNGPSGDDERRLQEP